MNIQRPAARYREVANDLRDAIGRGRLPTGGALPSRPSLARQDSLNQTSISRAIAILEAEGLVRAEHGRGSYVVDLPTGKRIRHIPPRGSGSGSSFAESMYKAGRSPRTELVLAEVIDPPAVVADYLDLGAGDRVLLRMRHMFADESPVPLAASYIPIEVSFRPSSGDSATNGRPRLSLSCRDTPSA